MNASYRSAIRRALKDNPARSHADIAHLFGTTPELVAVVAVDLLPTREQSLARRQLRARASLARQWLGTSDNRHARGVSLGDIESGPAQRELPGPGHPRYERR